MNNLAAVLSETFSEESVVDKLIKYNGDESKRFTILREILNHPMPTAWYEGLVIIPYMLDGFDNNMYFIFYKDKVSQVYHGNMVGWGQDHIPLSKAIMMNVEDAYKWAESLEYNDNPGKRKVVDWYDHPTGGDIVELVGSKWEWGNMEPGSKLIIQGNRGQVKTEASLFALGSNYLPPCLPSRYCSTSGGPGTICTDLTNIKETGRVEEVSFWAFKSGYAEAHKGIYYRRFVRVWELDGKEL